MEKKNLNVEEEYQTEYQATNFWKKFGLFALALGLALFTALVISL
jgi:hypothetical protein